jgi:predicted N-formylglutamate amidohydrolase
MTTLLGPDDPPPYAIVRPEGTARVLFVNDHGARAIPATLRQLGLADAVLDEHVAWDIGSRDVALHLAARFDAPLIACNYSRLVVDTNRPPDDATLCAPVSGGIAVPGNADLTEEDRALRRRAIFDPYHAAIDRQLARMRRTGIAPAVIAIHTCTPVFDRVVRPWHVGVLWDVDPRIAVPLLRALEARGDVCVGDNEPYSGKHPHDYTMDHHGEAAGLAHVSIEVRQDLVGTPDGAERWAGILGDALEPILADDGLYTLLP